MAYRSYGSTYRKGSGYRQYENSGSSDDGKWQFDAMKQVEDIKAAREDRKRNQEKYESERSDKELKQRIAQEDEDIMHRATYGATQSDILKDMEAKGPGMGPDTQPVSAFKKNPMTLDMMKSRARIAATTRSGGRSGGRGAIDRSQEAREAALTILDTLDPNKYKRSTAAELVVQKFPKLKWQSDQELVEALNRFPESVEKPKQSGIWPVFTKEFWMGKAKENAAKNAPAQAPEPIQDEPEPELPEQESDNPYADEYPDATWDERHQAWVVIRNGKPFKLGD